MKTRVLCIGVLLGAFSATAQVSISSILPNAVSINQDTFLTVNGGGFQPGFSASVTTPYGLFPLAAAALTYMSVSQLRVEVVLGGAAPYTAQLTITNPNGQKNSGSFQVVGPTGPVITAVSPATPVASSVDQALIVYGSGFKSGLTVQAMFPNGQRAMLSGAQIRNVTSTSFQLLATLNAAGTWTIVCTNPDFVQSNVFVFQVLVPSPGVAVQISNLTPASVPARDTLLNITVTGTGFTSACFGQWNGAPLHTAFVSSTQLTVTLDAQYLRVPGTAAITVTLPGGPASNSVVFVVGPPPADAPLITNVAPASLPAGALNPQISIVGANFRPDSQVRYNQSVVASTYVDTTKFQATISSELVALPGSATITVANPPDRVSVPYAIDVVGGLGSNPQSLNVQVVEGRTDIIEQLIQFFTSGQEASFTIGPLSDSWLAVTPTQGSLPALIHVLINLKGLMSGTYTSKIVLTSKGDSVIVPVSVTISPSSSNPFVVDAPVLQFSVTKNVTDSQQPMQMMVVTSRSNEDLSVQVGTKQGSPWLIVVPQQATVSPGQSVLVQISVTPALLPGGLSSGDSIVISAGGHTQEIPVVVSVGDDSGSKPLISAPAVTLQTVHGEYNPDEKRLLLYNGGSSKFDWTATHSENTIDLNPVANGPLGPGQYQVLKTALTALVQTLEVGEYPAKLIYRFSNTSASTQVDVHVQVLANGPLPPRPNTAGILLGLPGEPVETVTLKSFVGPAVSFSVTTDAPEWISITPSNGHIPKGNGSIDLTVSLAGKPMAQATGNIIIAFPGYDPPQRPLSIQVAYVGSPAPSSSAERSHTLVTTACAPSRLVAVFSSPGNLFSAPAALPVSIEARIADDCGILLTSGAALVTFSDGEPPVSLTYWPDGLWRGTWQPAAQQSGLVTLRLSAATPNISFSAHSIVLGACPSMS